MKKVSLLLAVLLVLTCCLLAACGDDGDASSAANTSSTNTSSAASSAEETTSAASSAAEESSKVEESSTPDESSVVDESSTDETTSDESSVEESSVEESSTPETSEPAAQNPGGDNLALNKSYTGAEPSAHPDVAKYNAKLTDGKANDAISYDGEWFAFYMNADATGAGYVNAPDRVGTVVIDLEKVCSISKVKINAFLGNASGIVAPASVKVEVSSDGSSYTQLGSAKTIDKPAENDVTVGWIEISGSAEGRYVKVTVEMDPYAPFCFLNEIEVY